MLASLQVRYVVPPFTPGGRVHVAFQFWIPISLSGFAVSGRELEAALKSPNPTAYITTLFLKHLSANTTAAELMGHLEVPVVEAAIDKFLEWVVPHLHYFTGNSINTVKTYTPRPDKKRKQKPWKIKRSLSRLSERKKRQNTLPGLEPEEDESTAKRSTVVENGNNDYLTLSLKCSDDSESKETEVTPLKTRKSRLMQETSVDVDTETKQTRNTNLKSHRKEMIEERIIDGVTETKHSESTNIKTRRRRLADEKHVEGISDFPDRGIEELVKDARNVESKSRIKRQAEERSLHSATDFVGEQKEELLQNARNMDLKPRRKRRAEERSLDEAINFVEAQNEEVRHTGNIDLKSRKKRQPEQTSLDEAMGLSGEQNEEESVQDASISRPSSTGLHRYRRQGRGASDGWVTIGGRHGGGAAGDSVNPTSPLLTRSPPWSSYRPSHLVPSDRLMWDDDFHVITHNDLSMEQDKRPGNHIFTFALLLFLSYLGSGYICHV